jgi:hypothetical protein
MPPNFGILPELTKRIRNKQERYGAYRDRALADLEASLIDTFKDSGGRRQKAGGRRQEKPTF